MEWASCGSPWEGSRGMSGGSGGMLVHWTEECKTNGHGLDIVAVK